MKTKLVYAVSEDWYFLSHRLAMAEAAKQADYEIHVLCNDTGKIGLINSMGFSCHLINFSRKSWSPIKLIFEIILFINLLKKIKPDILHLVSIRPIIVGGIASKFYKIPIKICAMTGLGHIFTSKSIIKRLVRNLFVPLLRFSVKGNIMQILVQNKDDFELMENLSIANKSDITLIRGSGIDINYYKPLALPLEPPIVVGFVSRMLEDKGAGLVIQAAKIIRDETLNIKFLLAGKLDDQNPTSLNYSDIINAHDSGYINWLNEVTDVREVWKQSHIAVLPSRREGLPKSLMEAAASRRCLIASDVPGCREIALDGINAILIPPDNVTALVKAIKTLAYDKNLRINYAMESRKLVESDLSSEIVGKLTVSMYQKLEYANKDKS